MTWRSSLLALIFLSTSQLVFASGNYSPWSVERKGTREIVQYSSDNIRYKVTISCGNSFPDDSIYVSQKIGGELFDIDTESLFGLTDEEFKSEASLREFISVVAGPVDDFEAFDFHPWAYAFRGDIEYSFVPEDFELTRIRVRPEKLSTHGTDGEKEYLSIIEQIGLFLNHGKAPTVSIGLIDSGGLQGDASIKAQHTLDTAGLRDIIEDIDCLRPREF